MSNWLVFINLGDYYANSCFSVTMLAKSQVSCLNMAGFYMKMGAWHDPSRDGNIEEYIARCRENMIPFCFKGLKPFIQLAGLGYITPNLSTVRVIPGLSNPDEFYNVIDGFLLEGISLKEHSGKPGIHKPETLLTKEASYWEIKELDQEKLEKLFK